MLQTILTAILCYTSTNIDDLFLLTLLCAQADSKAGQRSILTGHCLGIGALTAVSLLGAFGLQFIADERLVRLLGLIPILLGIRSWRQTQRRRRPFALPGNAWHHRHLPAHHRQRRGQRRRLYPRLQPLQSAAAGCHLPPLCPAVPYLVAAGRTLCRLPAAAAKAAAVSAHPCPAGADRHRLERPSRIEQETAFIKSCLLFSFTLILPAARACRCRGG